MGIFPSLYDKTNKLFKDRNVNQNAWAKMAEEIYLENDILLKPLYINSSKGNSKS